ncbi:MAG: hypothetical protein Q8903_14945, partial [Bacteroidota bacterium]|nr:hypothetical protein [Bacteroidota bacterium]
NDEKKKAGEILCLSLCFIAAILSLLRVSKCAAAFSFGYSLFIFLYYELITKSFLSNLPVKKSFSLSGIFIFSDIVVIGGFIVTIGTLFLVTDTVMVVLYIFGVIKKLVSPDAAIVQEWFVITCMALFYTNAVTLTLLSKRKTRRIAGITAITAFYSVCVYLLFPYKGGNLFTASPLYSYLQSTPNGWQIVGASILLTVVFSFGCILLAEFTDWYGHRRFKKSATAQ